MTGTLAHGDSKLQSGSLCRACAVTFLPLTLTGNGFYTKPRRDELAHVGFEGPRRQTRNGGRIANLGKPSRLGQISTLLSCFGGWHTPRPAGLAARLRVRRKEICLCTGRAHDARAASLICKVPCALDLCETCDTPAWAIYTFVKKSGSGSGSDRDG